MISESTSEIFLRSCLSNILIIIDIHNYNNYISPEYTFENKPELRDDNFYIIIIWFYIQKAVYYSIVLSIDINDP